MLYLVGTKAIIKQGLSWQHHERRKQKLAALKPNDLR